MRALARYSPMLLIVLGSVAAGCGRTDQPTAKPEATPEVTAATGTEVTLHVEGMT